jgi:hypothetical protein
MAPEKPMERRRLLPLLTLITLTGCAALTPEPSPQSPYYPPPVGSLLVLQRQLEIPADRVSIHIQDGQLRDYGALNRYRGYCKLEMWSRVDAPRTLAPDTFRITRVARESRAVGLESPLRVASRLAGFDPNDGPIAHVMSTEMYLNSERQPDVYRMTCSHWGEAVFPAHLSIEQMRTALGGMFRLKLPEEATD